MEEQHDIQNEVGGREDRMRPPGSAGVPEAQAAAVAPNETNSSPDAPPDDVPKESEADEKIKNLIEAVTKAELNVPEVTINFPERQGKTHSLQFSLQKEKNETKITLRIGIDARKDILKTFTLSYFQLNGKGRQYMRFRAVCGEADAQDVDSIVWSEDDRCYQLYKKLSDKIHPNYGDVLMYWFGDDQDMRPKITFANNGRSAADAAAKENERFLAFLSDYWPGYDDGTWNRVLYKNADIEDEDEEHSAGEGENPAANLHLIGIVGGVIGFLRKFIINGVYKDDNQIWSFGQRILGTDAVDIFIKKPDVDLNPVKFQKFLKEKKLFFDLNTLDMVCTALNSGDNVILTGGPGCGKTSLAKCLLEFSDYRGITATAASTWTTDELIGRYVPETRKDSGNLLKFQKGFFLEAIKDQKWLLIDEMNRAPIDQCFGELFSILSGHSVELPFEDRPSPEEPPRRIRIAPANSQDGGSSNETMTLTVSPSFRLLCTMNDVDKDKLEQLSFALQRRFHIIRLEAPGLDKVNDKILSMIEEKMKGYQKAGLSLFCTSKDAAEKVTAILTEAMTKLFASPEGLLAKGVIGMAQMIDVIKFSIRRLFLVSSISEVKNSKPKLVDLKSYVLSGIALGIVTKVYPQFPNFMGDYEQQKVLKDIIKLFREVFADLLMLSFYEASSPDDRRICDYLKKEFSIQFKRLLPDGETDTFWSETSDGADAPSE